LPLLGTPPTRIAWGWSRASGVRDRSG
jgi:hypothetical protein